jgi:flagellar biosynthesis GTPase FlhF
VKLTPKTPPSRLCHYCAEVVHTHKDSVFVVQEGEKRLYHSGCYEKQKREMVKRLRKEAYLQRQREQQEQAEKKRAEKAAEEKAAEEKRAAEEKAAAERVAAEAEAAEARAAEARAAGSPEWRKQTRVAHACITCALGRTRVYAGSPTGPHVRVCVDGHYQMMTLNGAVPTTEYAAQVWKTNAAAWHGYNLTASVMCTVCHESMARLHGMDHVLEKHAVPPVRHAVPSVPKDDQLRGVAVREVSVSRREANPDLQTQRKVTDLSLDDLLLELASRISARISNLEAQGSKMQQTTMELKVLVEQLLRGH